MSYDINLANKVREFLVEVPNIEVEEKEMFAVLNFMVNGKTCVCVSGENVNAKKVCIRIGRGLQESPLIAIK
jgi:flagellar basal body P-ring protein FlgI